jgi:hypothetical protein
MPERISSQPVLLLVIAAVFSFACSTKPSGLDSSAATASSPPAQASSPPNTSPAVAETGTSLKPALTDVEEAVKRVCVDAVTIDVKQSEPFIVGDFNGDSSQDLAVLVRPAKGALPKLNSEYANWIIEDPRKVVLPDPGKSVQKLPTPPPPEYVKANDPLLLVLHGYQQAGWHHQYARQTFLLRNAAGENVRAQSFTEALKTIEKKSRPQQQVRLGGIALSIRELSTQTNARSAAIRLVSRLVCPAVRGHKCPF